MPSKPTQRRAWILCGLIAIIFHSVTNHANEVYRPRHPRELPLGTRRDIGVRVKTAWIIAFNRYALERDFPQLRGLSDRAIETWMIRRLGYLNTRQLALTGIRNEVFDIDWNDVIDLHVAPGVGRGGEVEVDGQLVNLKANGNTWWNDEYTQSMIRAAKRGPRALHEIRGLNHRSGLEDQGMAVAEYIRHLELQQDYNRRASLGQPTKESVEAYGIMALGTRVLDQNDSPEAVVLIRQSNVGRTAYNRPLDDEIYTDHGHFQETNFGARVDFGGARLKTEVPQRYHERAGQLPLTDVPKFISDTLPKLAHTSPETEAPPPPVDLSWSVLGQSVFKLETPIFSTVINHRRAGAGKLWRGDTPEVARLKWYLLRASEFEVVNTLSHLPHESLVTLFEVTVHDFQMPLPEAAYRYGFTGPSSVRGAALRAATKVFDRFPKLVEPAVRLALAHADDPIEDDWEGTDVGAETWAMLNSDFEYPGYADLLVALMDRGDGIFRYSILEKLKQRPHLKAARNTVLRWIADHPKEDVLRLQSRMAFSQDVPRPSAECAAWLGKSPRYWFGARASRTK